jgi:hypothetical protein
MIISPAKLEEVKTALASLRGVAVEDMTAAQFEKRQSAVCALHDDFDPEELDAWMIENKF